MPSLFFGFSIQMPPETDLSEWPKARLLNLEERHLTLAFLGQVDARKLLEQIDQIPPPPFKIGMGGLFNCFLPLPPKRPRALTWEVAPFAKEALFLFQSNLQDHLKGMGYKMDDHPFLPHVTLARTPADLAAWQRQFRPTPLFLKGFHLYQSLGDLRYTPLWTAPLLPPFDVIDHTADEAFLIRGENLTELYQNAHLAIAFSYPPFAKYIKTPSLTHLDDVIRTLNASLSELDREEGSPFKAVSYHGSIATHSTLTWEMIIDV
ncbi:MAG: putative 2,5 ligase [Chlamydiales bacterium]|jgi:2'-5' RNA ligase|nr:putative 2,5 ligase [Chlamydiales bacterium]